MSDMDLKQLLLATSAWGVHGNSLAYLRWISMLGNLNRRKLPSGMQAYLKAYQKQLAGLKNFSVSEANLPSLEQVEAAIEVLLAEKQLEQIAPYQELRYCKYSEYFLASQPFEFILPKALSGEPMQWIRSQLQNYCSSYQISNESTDDLVIALSEAAENCVKYSSEELFYYSFDLKGDLFSFCFVNAIAADDQKDISLDELKKRYNEDISLMRGILVMNNLLDTLDLNQDLQKNIVIIDGTRTVERKK